MVKNWWRFFLAVLIIGGGLLSWLVMPVVSFLNEGEKISLVWLQNSDEIRATGGFLGSYAVVKTKGLAVLETKIIDIYEPDGKMRGFVGAPVGADKYLSDNHGWRLPDSNWSPDFPTATGEFQQILAMTETRELQPDLMIAINSQLVSKLIDLLGGIQLIDYQGLKVTGDNFETVARADRDDFFPGSKQKVNFLKHFYQQFQYRLNLLTNLEKMKIAQLLLEEGQKKNLQIWPNDAYPELQTLVNRLNLSGQIRKASQKSDTLYLLSLESNVGINKANAQIHRQSQAELRADPTQNQTELRLKINWQNQNQDEQNYYSNYQRFLLDPDAELTELVIDDQKRDSWDEAVITLKNGTQVKQIGFLLAFWAGGNSKVEATFKIPRLIKTINWDCQAGVDNKLVVNHQ